MNLIQNKKAEIGSTINWVVAFFIVVLFIFLYLTSVLVLAKIKGVDSGFVGAKIHSSNNLDLAFTKKFIAFVDSPISQGLSLYDFIILLEKGKFPEEKAGLVKSSLGNFMNDNKPASLQNVLYSAYDISLYDAEKHEFIRVHYLSSDSNDYPNEGAITSSYLEQEFFITSKIKLKFSFWI
jgi:hypothetical protein